MDLCVVGTGYVGLVTGTVFADLGYSVLCVDKDKARIAMLGKGKMPLYEPGLEEIVKRNLASDCLHFSTDIGGCIERSEIVLIAVGTPAREDGYANLDAVFEVAKIVARNLHSYKIVVNKSTVPVGTGNAVHDVIAANKVSKHIDFDVVCNPEFLREGSAIADTLHPDRVIIGASKLESPRNALSNCILLSVARSS